MAQTPPAAPADTTALAKEQQNPISSMATIPWQFNFNSGGGLEDGTFFLLNVQPVMPFKVTDRWNMIVRTIVPFVSMPASRDDPVHRDRRHLGRRIYVTPSKGGSFTWGVGPVVSMPTATTAAMQTGSWAAGPTFVALVMPGPWVVRCGREQRLDLRRRGDSATKIEPDFSPAVRQLQLRKSGTGLTVNTELTPEVGGVDHDGIRRTSWPAGLLRFGGQLVQLQVGPRIPVAAPEGGKADPGAGREIFSLPEVRDAVRDEVAGPRI